METVVAIVVLVGALVWAAVKIVDEQRKSRNNEQLKRNIKGQELAAQKRDRDELAGADAERVVGFLNSLRKDD